MADYPALPVWTDALIADTTHLTNEEFGAYLRLLIYSWRSPDCRLADDDKRMAIMLGVTDQKWKRSLRPVLQSFFKIHDGFWLQKRLRKEREYVEQKTAKTRKAANARWLKEKKTKYADVQTEHMQDDIQEHMHDSMQNPCNTASTHTHTHIDSDTDVSDGKPSKAIDPAKVVFDTGKALLARYKISGNKAGALITKWRKRLGDEALLALLTKAGSAERHDIVAFIEGCIRGASTNGASDGLPIDPNTDPVQRLARLRGLVDKGIWLPNHWGEEPTPAQAKAEISQIEGMT